MTGFEPATSGATVRRSATELHPPQEEMLHVIAGGFRLPANR